MVEHYSDVRKTHPSYLNDESNIVDNAKADMIYFSRSVEDIVNIVRNANKEGKKITVSGGGTGLSGGRVPHDDWILATDRMISVSNPSETWTDQESKLQYSLSLIVVDDETAELRVPVAMTLKSIQNYVREKGWFYPPDPTERTSFIGGNVATNASGARTFRFGPTRKWVQGMQIVLADGSLLSMRRDKDHGKITSENILLKTENINLRIPRPSYKAPNVTKNVAGPVIDDNSDPMDLFIGSNGIFGIITEVTIRLIRPPEEILSIFVFCETLEQALEFIEICQGKRELNEPPVPMSVEFLDDRAIKIMRLNDERIPDAKALIMMEQDVFSEEQLEIAIERWSEIFESLGIEETSVAQTYSEIEHHKFLRHCVPEHVIRLSKSYGQKLIASDNSVPIHNFKEFFYFLIDSGTQFENFQIKQSPLSDEPGYVLFGHAGDCHPHLGLLPRNDLEGEVALDLLIKIFDKVMELEGSIASEHGLGKKRYGDRPALFIQYGQQGLDEIRSMKQILDPAMILNPGNLIDN